MKQLAFMIVTTLLGTAGVFAVAPFWGVAVYYLFAVLRPQYLWGWTLPRDMQWSEFVAIATIAGGVAQALGFLKGEAPAARRRFSAAHKFMLLFGCWIGVTYFAALDRETAYKWFIDYLKIFVMFGISTLIVRTLRQLWILLLIAAVSLAYIAYEVNSLYLFQNRYLGIYHNGYGGLDNNGAGLMLAMGIPLCASVWEGSRRWWRWIFAAAIPVLLHAVLMSYSRGAMLALALVSPLILVRSRRRRVTALGGIAFALMLPVLAGPEIRAEFFSIKEYDVDASSTSRISSWEAGWQMVRDNPLFGVGLRNSNLFSREYGADIKGRTIHNQYIQLAADSGFPALALYLLTLTALWLSLRQVRRRTRGCRTDDERRAYAIATGVEGAMALFCVGATFLSLEVFELPYLLVLIGATLSSVCPQDQHQEARAGRPSPAAVTVRHARGEVALPHGRPAAAAAPGRGTGWAGGSWGAR